MFNNILFKGNKRKAEENLSAKSKAIKLNSKQSDEDSDDEIMDFEDDSDDDDDDDDEGLCGMLLINKNKIIGLEIKTRIHSHIFKCIFNIILTILIWIKILKMLI